MAEYDFRSRKRFSAPCRCAALARSAATRCASRDRYSGRPRRVGLPAFLAARPIGDGPAGPSVSGEPFETVWSERPVLLLGFGDSVTAGFGAPRGHGYFDRIAENPADEFEELKGICLQRVLPKLQTCNLALSGSTSLEHAEMLVSKIEPQVNETLGIVVMTTGGNDVIHNYGRTPPRRRDVRRDARRGAAVDRELPAAA